MESHSNPLQSILAGALSGILFLGIIGRLFTASIELIARNNLNISISGVF